MHGLFGRFSYQLDVAPTPPQTWAARGGEILTVNEDRLSLLYGRNGSGKTTILRLLFHALSPAGNRGHRTALFGIPFRRLEIVLTDGTRLTYERRDEHPVGPYRAEISSGGRRKAIVWDYQGPTSLAWSNIEMPIAQLSYGFGKRGDQEQRFLSELRALAINPVFLGDSRAITSDSLEREDVTKRLIDRSTDVDEVLRAARDLDAQAALQRVSRYLSQLTFAGAQAGSQRVDSVYVNVVAAITAAPIQVEQQRGGGIPELTARVLSVGERTLPFFRYGLLPEFPTQPLVAALSTAPLDRAPLLSRVLDPYLDGTEARMDALEQGMRSVASFIDALNSFLESKRAEFRLGGGGAIIVEPHSGEPLEPAVLSSGEKQIVLLFSDITALQSDTRLFIIDEPELSLNPNWQRTLMPRLLEVTEQSGMQLIAATHSTEIMARYHSRIRQLDG